MNFNSQYKESDHWFTNFEYNGERTIAILQDQAVFHAITGEDVSKEPTQESSTFTLDRYSSETFQGIMPDTGAAGVSTAGHPQFLALQKLDPNVQLDISTAGNHTIRFGKGSSLSEGTIWVATPFGTIPFQVVSANTPFLLCLGDMDRLGIRFDNLCNELIQGKKRVPIVRRWGHPFLLLHQPEQSMAYHHLTETELRQLHRRFGHPSVSRLVKILQRAGYDEIDNNFIKHLTKVCHQCQIHSKSPGRFKFTLKDDHEFNYTIFIDIFNLEDGPVLHVVDSATAFNAGRFIKDFSAQATWDTLRICWIDVYQGPPEYIVTDAGRNFASKEFKQNAKVLNIEVKEVPVEAHNSVGKVERYHGPLRRAYEIIKAELTADCGRASKELILQMALKAINDTAGPNGLVPTLLVFGSYPRIANYDLPTPTIAQRSNAIRIAMKELRNMEAKRKVTDALGMLNGPNTLATLNLPPNSKVRVWREHEGSTKRGG